MMDVTTRNTSEPANCSNIEPYVDDVRFEYTLNELLALAPEKLSYRTIPAGTDLFRAGDPCDAIYCLADGWIALYDLFEDGRRQILQFAFPGATLAFSPTPGATMHYSAQAMTDVTIRSMARRDFVNLCTEHVQLGLQLAWRISRDRDLAYDRLGSIGHRSAQIRVAYLLLELFVRCRLRWPGYHIEEMHLPLTQEDIGDATGLTGVHVNRVLRDLRMAGILEFHYHKLRILNPDKLMDAAGIESHATMSWAPSRSQFEPLDGSKVEAVVPFKPGKGANNDRSRRARKFTASFDDGHQDLGRSA